MVSKLGTSHLGQALDANVDRLGKRHVKRVGLLEGSLDAAFVGLMCDDDDGNAPPEYLASLLVDGRDRNPMLAENASDLRQYAGLVAGGKAQVVAPRGVREPRGYDGPFVVVGYVRDWPAVPFSTWRARYRTSDTTALAAASCPAPFP